MAVEYKLEGDVLVVKAGLSAGVDKDKDGVQSVSVGGNIEIRLDGSEVADELLKSSDLLEKVKAKLGL
jgi:hypothetical protein